MRAHHHPRALVAAALAMTSVLGGAVTSSAGTATTVSAGTVAATDESGTSISGTDAPVRVHVGAAVTPVRMTVVTAGAVDGAGTRLVDRGRTTMAQARSDGAEPGRPRVHKVDVGVVAQDLTHWGPMAWEVSSWTSSDGSCAFGSTSVATDVRAHSMLGVATSRDGSTVTLKGSLRAYHNIEARYVAWSGRAVSVQRWTGTSWSQVTGARTNTQGDITLRLALPSGTSIRLVAGDTSSTWGAVSRTAAV